MALEEVIMSNRVALILLLASGLLWSGCAVRDGAFNDLRKGHQFFADERYDEAIGAYQQAPAVDNVPP